MSSKSSKKYSRNPNYVGSKRKYSSKVIGKRLARFLGPLAQARVQSTRYKDTTINASPSSTGLVTGLPFFILGDTNGERDGTSVTLRRLQIRCSLAAANVTFAFVRILVLYDKQANAATHLVNDYLQATDVNAFTNINNKRRFIKIWDKVYKVGFDNGNPNQFNKIINLKNKKVFYNTSNNGTVADVVTGNLTVVTLSNVAAGVNTPTMDLHTRLWYDP
jgi:hypothetical protein